MPHKGQHSDPDDSTAAGPIVRLRSEHRISRKDIDPDALKVLYRLHECGHKAYLVGGGVRDLLLGRKPKDFDIGTDAHPQEIRRMFRNCFLIGRRFRLAHIRFGEKVIETSTFRREPEHRDVETKGHGPLLQHHDNTFGTPEEDARRRDFTINGIFYDIATFSVIDHVGGLADLARRIVHCIGNPDIRFREDPVRMVRAVRFAARLGFTIEQETHAAILRHHHHIAQAAAPRMLEEIYRLFGYQSGEHALRLLHETGLLSVMFPEIDDILKRGGEWADLFWGCMESHDWEESQRGRISEPLIFGSLLVVPFQKAMSHEAGARSRTASLDLATRIVQPHARRYCMPKWLFYRVTRMLATLGRLERLEPPPAAHRLAAQEGFGEAIALSRIYRSARGLDDGPLEFWQGQYELLHGRRRSER